MQIGTTKKTYYNMPPHTIISICLFSLLFASFCVCFVMLIRLRYTVPTQVIPADIVVEIV